MLKRNKNIDKKKVKFKTKKKDGLLKMGGGTGLFFARMITLSLLLIFVGWWGYTQVMKMALGNYKFFDWLSFQETTYTEDLVLLLSPIRTENYLMPDDEDRGQPDVWPYIKRTPDWNKADTLWYAKGMRNPKEEVDAWEEIVGHTYRDFHFVDWWEELFILREIKYKLVYEHDLMNLRRGNFVLILPGALLLSQAEKEGIKEFVANGGSLLMCWSPGCRDETGNWAGFDFMSQIIGGLPAGSVEDPTGGTSVVLKGNNPISAMIPPGTHLELYTYNGYIAMDLVEPRANCDGFWFKPYWKDRSNQNNRSNVGLAHGSYIDGRYVWFSFTPETIQEHKDNNAIIDRLVLNTIDYLKRKGVALAEIWPNGMSAGGGVMLKSEDFTVDLLEVLKVAENSVVDVDIILGDNASKEVTIDNQLPNDVFIASRNTTSLMGRPVNDQKEWMESQSNWMRKLTGNKPVGLFPARWETEIPLYQAAAKANIQLILGEIEPRYYGPKVREIRPNFFSGLVPISAIPKSQLTLEEWHNNIGLSGGAILNGMVADLQRIRRAGGLYLAIMDPAILREQGLSDLPIQLAQKMDELNVWQAPAEDLITRFSAWRGLRISTNEKTAQRLVVRVSNEGKYTIENIGMKVFLTRDVISVSIKSELIGTAPTDIRWDRTTGICRFVIPKLGPRDNTSIFIDKSFGYEEEQ